MKQRPRMPTARDIMRKRVQTLRPEDDIESAVRVLLAKGISGAPVVDAEGRLEGLLSEHDCLQVLAQSISSGWPNGHVRDHMSATAETVEPTDDLLLLARRMSEGRLRRVIVAEDGQMVGLVSRGDLLGALETFEEKLEHPRKSTYELIDERHRQLD